MNVSQLLKFCKKLFNVFMPNLCFVCQEPLPFQRKRLCPGCFDELSLLDPTNRCPFCFEEQIDGCKGKCSCTTEREYPFFLSFCFPPLPAAKWVERDLKTKADDMVKGISALMSLQLISLHWPSPDVIIPYGSKSARLIARHLASTLNSQYYNPLVFSKKIEDKIILIISPHIHSRREINPLVEKLITRYPKRIFVLGLCHL